MEEQQQPEHSSKHHKHGGVEKMQSNLKRARSKQTTRLNLSGCKLTVIAMPIFELIHLTELNVSNNKIRSLPVAVVKVSELKNLR